ncbi:MAG: 30S ribosomal protein S6 [Lachnospiraceae bacterium]|jgi:small subunit ribosomal protein S6|nr:30S ribosomal protein S6 [Lachnospiraceae bacterium]
MNKYELALVISAKLDDEARTAVLDRAKEYISRHGGVVGETEEWGKRKLAYEIQKQTEAYYYFVQFEAEGETPNELEGRMRIMDNVLRYLVVRKGENDVFSVVPEKTEEAPAEEEAEEAPAEEVEEAPAEEEAEEAPAEEAAEAAEE